MKGFALAPGLQVELAASEPGLANPVTFVLDDRNRLLVVETFRLHKGVTDNREHVYWIDEDLAARTVADRVAMQTKYQADELETFAKYQERIRILEDTDGDRVFDKSTVFADGWNRLEDGIAAGILAVDDDVFLTNIPSLWRLRDTDGDGVADARDNLQDGYGVHVSLLGHDMHGLVLGPDRRLYFSIGDRGFTVEQDGQRFDYPHEGAVLRCELDGSALEVVHRGLRNPQELAFDALGNLFTGDNNSDGGDKARWVYVVDGGHSGWCIGYQYLNDRGAWNREKLWWPRFPEQAAFLVPAIVNVASGPSGLAYYPGTGLPPRYQDTFFLCDFRGAPGPSGVWNLRFSPSGAGFEMVEQTKFIWNVLPTDVGFGPEGGLYLADWVTGWGQTGKGRVYRVHDPKLSADRNVRAVKRLLNSDLAQRPVRDLLDLLSHPDQRLRQKAQFALVDHGAAGVTALTAVAHRPGDVMPRLHGIWGAGIAGRANPDALDPLLDLLRDGHAEVRAQTAKVLGDSGHERWAAPLRTILDDPNSRVRFFAAQALGHCAQPADDESIAALVATLQHNNDRDAYLRHGAVVALSRIASAAQIAPMLEAPDRALRMGAVLALRRLQSPAIAAALADGDLGIAVEAARAIYDFDGITSAMGPLTERDVPVGDDEQTLALGTRILNAQRWRHQPDDARALLASAQRAELAPFLRQEALAILAEWRKPSGRDRVFGNWRPVGGSQLEPTATPDTPLVFEPDAALQQALGQGLITLLENADSTLANRAIDAMVGLSLQSVTPGLTRTALGREHSAQVRSQALEALARLGAADLSSTLDQIPSDAPAPLRMAKVRLLGTLDPGAAMATLETLVEAAPLRERQNAVRTLAGIDTAPAHALVAKLLGRVGDGSLDSPLHLEVLEAADKHRRDPAVADALATLGRPVAVDKLAAFLACLDGGDAQAGERVFRTHTAATCMRCHSLGGTGGDAGPLLDGVGSRLDRRALLQSMIEPAADLAEGFGSILFNMQNGDIVQGIVVEETADLVSVKDIDSKMHRLATAQIARRSEPTTSMPAMGGTLTARQLRDLVEFLAQQTSSDGAQKEDR